MGQTAKLRRSTHHWVIRARRRRMQRPAQPMSRWKGRRHYAWSMPVLRGSRPPATLPEFVKQLPQANVPANLKRHITQPGSIDRYAVMAAIGREIASVQPDAHPSVLTLETYRGYFETIIFVEEIQMLVDIRLYDLENEVISLDTRSRWVHHIIKVPGLAEKRPSIMRGDRILARPHGAGDSSVVHQGFVHFVNLEDIRVSFHASFRDHAAACGNRFDVQFTFTRTPQRVMHRALRLADAALLSRLLPSTPPLPSVHQDTVCSGGLLPSLHQPPPAVLDNSSGAATVASASSRLNALQQQAVDAICGNKGLPPRCSATAAQLPGASAQGGLVTGVVPSFAAPSLQDVPAAAATQQAPFVIFGPPGTGKTHTVVAAIRALLDTWPGARVLVCAPSNVAADLLCARLAIGTGQADGSSSSGGGCRQLTPGSLFRLNAMMRNPKHMEPRDVMSRFSDYRDGCFCVPELPRLLGYRVVVATCISAGYLTSMGVPTGHFSHVFIDECGEALEPEALSALCLAGPSTGIILAGDSQQLGPIVRSPIALQYRLDRSLLERVVATPGLGTCTRLRVSYRAHPGLLQVYSDLFYDGTLVTEADPALTHSLLGWHRLPNPDIPLLLAHVDGDERRDADSPSWYNQAEINAVEGIMNDLLASGLGVRPDEIGIITPYQKQVHKFKCWVHNAGARLEGVRVGTVEAFQGQERKVIVLSAVRSRRREHVQGEDRKFRLGFLHNPKRLNVAISRAQALLVVVGNVHTLRACDPHWQRFVDHCAAHRLYVGPPLPTDVPCSQMGTGSSRQSQVAAGSSAARTVSNHPVAVADQAGGSEDAGEEPAADESWVLVDDHCMNADASWRDEY
eukprot:jgi/Mesvir1/25055/Mv11899-RA.1